MFSPISPIPEDFSLDKINDTSSTSGPAQANVQPEGADKPRRHSLKAARRHLSHATTTAWAQTVPTLSTASSTSVDLTALFAQHPDIKHLYDQEVIQLTATLNNEGPHGPNVAPLLTKHRQDYTSLLQSKNIKVNSEAIIDSLCQKEWADSGGKSTSPILNVVQDAPIHSKTHLKADSVLLTQAMGAASIEASSDPDPIFNAAMLIAPSQTAPEAANSGLTEIANNFQSWTSSHPADATAIQPIVAEINLAIATLQNSSAQNSGPALRAYIQLATVTKALFNSDIYSKLTSPEALNTLFAALNFDPRLLPATTQPTAPPFKTGYTVYMLNHLPPESTVQITSAQGYVTIDANGFGSHTAAPTTLTLSQLPQFNGGHYVYMPNNTSSGRITFGNPTVSRYPTFCEFTTSDGSSLSYVNFTAVDCLTPQMLNIQMTNDHGSSIRSGVSVDNATMISSMTNLYNSYDPTGVWASTMFNTDGSIKSGKNMADPRIKESLSNYLSNTFIPGISQSHPLYFIVDGTVKQGYFVPSGAPSGWNFQIVGGISMPVPALNDVDSWLSGSDAGWNSNPSKAPMTSAQWAITKSLSGLVNVGIIPGNINSSPSNPIINDYFNSINNIKNFYQASFYNLYRRAVHESGCNAYASDFDDVLNADGTLIGSPKDHTFFTISFTPLTASEIPTPTPTPTPEPTPTPVPVPEPTPTPVPADLTSLFAQYPDVKQFYDQEVIQLTATLKNEGPSGPNVVPLLTKHKEDFVSLLNSKNLNNDPSLLYNLCQQEWLDGGGTGTSPILSLGVPTPTPPPVPVPEPTPTPVPVDLTSLFAQYPDVKQFYDQEVIQLTATLKNEGPSGPNVLPLLSKHKEDFISLLNSKNLGNAPSLLYSLCQQEWLDGGGTGTSPILGSEAPAPAPTPTPTPTPVADLTALFTQYPDIDALYQQEVIQLRATLNNEGPNGPNIIPLLAKHQLDFTNALKAKNIYTLNLLQALCQLEWTAAGGPGVSPILV